MSIGRVRGILVFLITICVVPAAGHRSCRAWQTSAPADLGIDKAALSELDADITAGQYGYVDSILVVRCGRAVFDRSYRHDYRRIYGGRSWLQQPRNGQYNYFNADWHPFYDGTSLHTMQSVSKTVTALTIGVAITHGDFHASLDTPVLRYFDVAHVKNVDPRKQHMTLRHLLTMTSGLDWNEDLPYGDANSTSDQMEATRDWIQFVIDRPMAHDPGTVWTYSSGVAELFAHIFREETGKDITKYAERNLFQPLGISKYYWKRTPLRLPDTEGGLYLEAHDLAKLGALMLGSGRWNGEQIISADWIRQMVAPSATVLGTRAELGSKYGFIMKYGFQTWLYQSAEAPERMSWSAAGFGGQGLVVSPERDLIVVYTSWNILPDAKVLKTPEALGRLLPAVKPQSCSAVFKP